MTTGSAGVTTVAAGAACGTAAGTGGVAGALLGAAGGIAVSTGAGAAAVGAFIWSGAELVAGVCANPKAPSRAVTTISSNTFFMESSEESRLAVD